jgi:hypothetical protein
MLRAGFTGAAVQNLLQQRGGFERVVSRNATTTAVELAFYLNEPSKSPCSFEIGIDQLGVTYQRATADGHTFDLNRGSGSTTELAARPIESCEEIKKNIPGAILRAG